VSYSGRGSETSAWSDACLAATLFAVDPAGTGGVAVRAMAGPVRDQWIALLRGLLPASAPMRRVPLHVGDGRLLGGLDLPATLQAGRPVAERGILADVNGGVVELAMAERLSASTAGRIAAVLDLGGVTLERDGVALRTPTRFGVVALDEGMTADERPPEALLDRFAFHLDLSGIDIRAAVHDLYKVDEVVSARTLLPTVRAGDAVFDALCAAAVALGVRSIRASILAVRVARIAAALAGRTEVLEEDAALAARLVFAPRATIPPTQQEPEREEEEADTPVEHEGSDASDSEGDDQALDDRPLSDIVLEAAQAAIPAGLLAELKLSSGATSRAGSQGRAGILRQSRLRGRPIGTRRGEPRSGARLNIIETLRAAAPWQRLRRAERAMHPNEKRQPARIEVRREDFHVTRFKQRAETTTIFVVDASGSAALHRLAEAKGAVELLLADCYVRRDRVALLAFRGISAELLLPPTRSLARAKRSLASLPGGGGTPLAAGIDAAVALADAAQRKGETPVVIFLTDGRANVARDGKGGRPRAEEEALTAGRMLRMAGLTAMLVDTSPQPQPQARRLATEMSAAYLPLPHAGAMAISRAVRSAVPQQPGGTSLT
jgi:magnesium chelatase subunit D